MSEFVLLLSVMLQFSAAFVALSHVRIPNYRAAWILITSALFLMGLRRSVTLFDILFGSAPAKTSLTPEIIALVISSLMLVGVVKMGRVFREMAKDKDQSIKSENRLLDFAEVSADWFWEQDKDLRFTFISVTNIDVSGLLPEDH